MPCPKGMIVLMGSGELSTTMVAVHKEVLSRLPKKSVPVFMDTPAGFQLNVDEISRKAVAYFKRHVQSPMTVASIKSAKDAHTYGVQNACKTLEAANYILIGPGSPSYAVKQWGRTRVPEILTDRIQNGACLVAASAAALTLGRFTLPVYEIYKVGQNLHWIEGLDIFKHFGLNLLTVPHWNNAEGGTHDTRFCYMGKTRFDRLRALLPEDVDILGLDEHTACIIDFENQCGAVRGIGQITYIHQGREMHFQKGEQFSLEILFGKNGSLSGLPADQTATVSPGTASLQTSGQTEQPSIRSCEKAFYEGLAIHDAKTITDTLLEMENLIWEFRQSDTDDHTVNQARHILKTSFAALGQKFEGYVNHQIRSFVPLVETLIQLRNRYRTAAKYQEADAIRDCLAAAGIQITDDKNDTSWTVKG